MRNRSRKTGPLGHALACDNAEQHPREQAETVCLPRKEDSGQLGKPKTVDCGYLRPIVPGVSPPDPGSLLFPSDRVGARTVHCGPNTLPGFRIPFGSVAYFTVGLVVEIPSLSTF